MYKTINPWILFMTSFFTGTTIGLLIGFIAVLNTRNDLVLQTCDYSRVAGVDTVTELCTKFQQQTHVEYFCNLKNECKVE